MTDFLAVDFTAVLLAGLEDSLLVVFAEVLVVAFAGALLALVFAGVLLADFVAVRLAAAGAADASISGFFLDRAVARTCLIAFTCSSSVIRNSWWPSRLATK